MTKSKKVNFEEVVNVINLLKSGKGVAYGAYVFRLVKKEKKMTYGNKEAFENYDFIGRAHLSNYAQGEITEWWRDCSILEDVLYDQNGPKYTVIE